MLKINLLGTRNSDVTLEWEINDLLGNAPRYKKGTMTFAVKREEPLPFMVSGTLEGWDVAFSFDEEEAVLRISKGKESIEVQSRLDTSDIVQVLFRDEVYDSRHALSESSEMVKPAALYSLLSLAMECCGGENKEPCSDMPRKRMLTVTEFASRKMAEAQRFFSEIVDQVLAWQEEEGDEVEESLLSLDVPLPFGKASRKKGAARKAARKK